MCIEFLNILCEKRVKLSEDIITWVCQKIVINQKLTTKLRSSGLDFLQTLC